MSIAAKLEIPFSKERETKGTFVYSEDAEAGSEKIGRLYIKKSAAAELNDPESIKVTIEPTG